MDLSEHIGRLNVYLANHENSKEYKQKKPGQ